MCRRSTLLFPPGNPQAHRYIVRVQELYRQVLEQVLAPYRQVQVVYRRVPELVKVQLAGMLGPPNMNNPHKPVPVRQQLVPEHTLPHSFHRFHNHRHYHSDYRFDPMKHMLSKSFPQDKLQQPVLTLVMIYCSY